MEDEESPQAYFIKRLSIEIKQMIGLRAPWPMGAAHYECLKDAALILRPF